MRCGTIRTSAAAPFFALIRERPSSCLAQRSVLDGLPGRVGGPAGPVAVVGGLAQAEPVGGAVTPQVGHGLEHLDRLGHLELLDGVRPSSNSTRCTGHAGRSGHPRSP